ncbi:MAG TPA: single-stranded-DNA-specific exonuclease RecJ [Candidatus Rifleibacterium sp.]|nr:single-stranded-DNA-specific exonuclease RecJ [Candidatus Rifleibacterium sp.]
MEKVWKFREVPETALDRLRSTGFPDILLKILINRGIKDAFSIEKYFSPRSRYLFSPFVIDGLCPAVDRIFKAFERDESIRVYGDRDVDGITSTVLLTETLRSYHKLVDYTVPVIEDGYGLNPDYIDVAARDGIKLIVTVDCGISNIAEVEYARSKGIEVIITDHHEPPSQLPAAVAIVDPKLHDSCCPQKNIAGVGVAFKMAMALEMARCNRLSRPLLVFDHSEHDIAAVRFSVREGFTPVKNIDRAAFSGCVPVFYSEAERRLIGELIPVVLASTSNDPAFKPVYVDKVIAECLPDAAEQSKVAFRKSLNLDQIDAGRALTLIYLKCIEAKLPAVKALWHRSLDILTIGTVADMVPLQGENRTFAQMGLKFVGKSKRLGLASLFSALGWKNRLVTERDISFSIAPILNASGRLRTAELAIELLGTTQASRAEELAKQLFELNNERKRLGEDCYNGVKRYLIEQNDVVNDRILMVAAPMKNQGVTGIVATRLMLDYCRPVIVLLEDQGKFLGSARSFKSLNIIEALNYCSECLEKYGGHIGAAGLTMPPGNETLFRQKLREYAATNISEEDLRPEWLIDSELPIEKIDEQFLQDILNFAPFGIENPAPVFAAMSAPFQEIRKVGEGKNHLRFKFKRSNGRSIFGIGFNLGDIMAPDTIRDGTCDLVFHVEPNDYNGVRSAQLMVLDCRIRGFK